MKPRETKPRLEIFSMLILLILLMATLSAGPAAAQYCDASGGGTFWASLVQVGDIYNTSGDEGYEDFTHITTEMYQGAIHPIYIEEGHGWVTTAARMWIDWNGDEVFDESTEEITLVNSDGSGPYTGMIIVPIDAVIGQTRMRIRVGGGSPDGPCGFETRGEVEDYGIDITAAPPYCAGMGGGMFWASRVQVGDIDNYSDDGRYEDFTDLSTEMPQGSIHTIHIEEGSTWVTTTARMWIDWNGDTDFDESTEEITLVNVGGSGPYNGVINVPIDAVIGQTRMRIRVGDNSPIGPCGYDDRGEVEDYTIDITEAPPYCEAMGGGMFWASLVQVGDIDNPSGDGGYEDFTSLSTEMAQGSIHSIYIEEGSTWVTTTARMWIDWNGDQTLDEATEEITLVNAGGSGPYTGMINVPIDAAIGSTRMRIRVGDNSPIGPCGYDDRGEVEDYTIDITEAPPYCAAMGDGMFWASLVQVGDIDNPSGDGGYEDFTEYSTEMLPGSSYPIYIEEGHGWVTTAARMWIDWNGDEVFDEATEEIDLENDGGSGPYTGLIDVPLDAAAGQTRMRIRVGDHDPIGPCGHDDRGEVEDYTIVVMELDPYCAAEGAGPDHISHVLLGDIDHTSGYEGQALNTHLTTDLAVGAANLLTVQGTGVSTSTECRVWADWNGDLDFDDDDEELIVDGSPGVSPYTATVTPPLDAVLGQTRLRIRLATTAAGACGMDDDGEVEDYSIEVVPAAATDCDDFESDQWTFHQTNPDYSGTFIADYVGDHTHSPVRAIKTALVDGQSDGQDFDHVYGQKSYAVPAGTQPEHLSVWYSFDGYTGTSAMHAYCNVIIAALDESETLLDQATYCVAAYDYNIGGHDYENMPDWIYQETRPDEYESGAPDYGRDPDNSLLPPEGWWYRLQVDPSADMDVIWGDVASVRIQLRCGGAYLHSNSIGIYWDDFCIDIGEDDPPSPVPSPTVGAYTLLEPNYPNPFNPSTCIVFNLSREGDAQVRIFDLQGRLVRLLFAGRLPAGRHEVTWQGHDTAGRVVPSGTYLYAVTAGGRTEMRKMVMLK